MSTGRLGEGDTAVQQTIFDAKADLLTATAADTPARLAVGTNNHTLIADSSAATGLSYAAGSKATLTTTGDILYASSANTPARLGIGSSGQVLTVSGGIPGWATASSSSTFAGCRVYKSAAQSIPNATGTAITFNSEDFDTDNYHSTSTNTSRITIPAGKAGYYFITGRCYFGAVGSVKPFAASIIKNGTTNIGGIEIDSSVTYETGRQVSGISYLSVGDYVELYAYQETGGNFDVTQNNNRTMLAVGLLGA